MFKVIIVDRFEGNLAVCEEETKTIEIPKADLPADAKEGDVLMKGNNGAYEIDRETTKQRRKNIDEKFFGLFVD